MLTDRGIREALGSGDLDIDPFEAKSLQPASYDLRVGRSAFSSSASSKIDVASRGLVVVEPGEFVVVETLERVGCSASVAAQLGLASEYARQGVLLLSGPQVDPGFDGILVVRLMNLSPSRVGLPYGAPFLTAQFFKLAAPVEHPYQGSRQGQQGIGPVDIQELTQTEALTLGQVVKTIGALAENVSRLTTDVAELRGTVNRFTWLVPLVITIVMTLLTIIVSVAIAAAT